MDLKIFHQLKNILQKIRKFFDILKNFDLFFNLKESCRKSEPHLQLIRSLFESKLI
jgi:hypothetical protein